MRLGVLDIGSNTVHLLVVDARVGGAPLAAASLKRELRLAEHMDDRERITPEGRRALVDMVAESRRFAEDKGCQRVLPFVTSALRDAANSEEIIAEVRHKTGVELHVLTGVDESRATFLAARRWYGWSAGTLAVFDIGGGSLEIACGRDEEPDLAVSIPVGAGRMMRRFGDKNIGKMRRHVRAEIGNVVGDVLRRGPFDRTVATSKTFRTLGRIAGAAPSSQGPYVLRTLSREQLSKWVTRLAGMNASHRANLPGVSAGRAQQILAGAVVAEAVMDLSGLEYLDLCPWALREGIILNYLDHLEYFGASAGPAARRLDANLSLQFKQLLPPSLPVETPGVDTRPDLADTTSDTPTFPVPAAGE